MIFSFSGLPGSGKDTCCEILKCRGFEHLSFAGRLKEGLIGVDPMVTASERLSDILDKISFDDAKRKYPEVRRLAQRYGTEGGRDIHGDNCWVNVLEDKMFSMQVSGKRRFCISDTRFENEFKMLKARRAIFVRVRGRGKEVASHASEAFWPDWQYDYIIQNDGDLEQLGESVEAIVSAELLKEPSKIGLN